MRPEGVQPQMLPRYTKLRMAADYRENALSEESRQDRHSMERTVL